MTKLISFTWDDVDETTLDFFDGHRLGPTWGEKGYVTLAVANDSPDSDSEIALALHIDDEWIGSTAYVDYGLLQKRSGGFSRDDLVTIPVLARHGPDGDGDRPYYYGLRARSVESYGNGYIPGGLMDRFIPLVPEDLTASLDNIEAFLEG